MGGRRTTWRKKVWWPAVAARPPSLPSSDQREVVGGQAQSWVEKGIATRTWRQIPNDPFFIFN